MRPHVLAAALLGACQRATPSPAADAGATVGVTATAATAPSGAASATATGAPAPPVAGVLVIEPALPPFEREANMDHLKAFGWTRDGARFGYLQVSGGTGVERLLLRAPGGAAESFDDEGPLRDGQADPKAHGELERRVRELGFTTAPVSWPWGGEMVVTWSAVQGRIAPPYAPGVLRVGARVKGEAASYPMHLADKRPDNATIHPEAIAMSPDGRWIGAIGHAFVGEFSDAFPTGTMSTSELAGHAYNDAGFARHRAGEWARAAELFAKATVADPAAKKPRYNLACAYARLGDARAQAALAAAIAKDGDEVVKKARTDPDFDGVRSAAWFVALVAP